MTVRAATINVFTVGHADAPVGVAASVGIVGRRSLGHVTTTHPLGAEAAAYADAEQWCIDHGVMPPCGVEARVYEQGNGWPSPGDYCVGNGVLYRIASQLGRICVGDRLGNWAPCIAVTADWSECPPDGPHSALVMLDCP